MDRIGAFALSNLEAVMKTYCIYIGSSKITSQDFDGANYTRGHVPMLPGKVSFPSLGRKDKPQERRYRYQYLCRVLSL